MANNNKSYRIRTTVGHESDSFLNVHLDQDYDSLEILSLKISDKDTYKLHNSDYGIVVGRVLANGNFGVPNAKISVFIPADEQNENMDMWNIYPYTSTSTKNEDGVRYNLLPDKSVKDCHKAVGTFPNKTFLLENDAIIDVFDKYYVYTTRTNSAGDYLICGVPTGMQTLHMDLDLSDCGILSQRPRDFVYKGYTIEQFENPNQFKKDENIDGLSQIFSQNQSVYVQPFWGNEDNGEEIGITRADIEIAFKFEPTCVFMGSAISDNASNGVGKKCVPTNQMGAMDELTAGEGTIEMIRKTPAGNVEEFSIKGNQLIDGNGVWCYQIPMNLDYMMTDEYGNMVPTDDPEKGIPTRTRVRFRASLTDMENSSQSYYRAKYLIPNNPDIEDKTVDYNFGTYTDEKSYRDLFWNGVYTVKSYIPRFQKSKRWRSERFSGIKACNYYGGNNPMPYNNLRIKLPFMFTVLCIFVKLFIKIVTLVNRLESGLIRSLTTLVDVLGIALKGLALGLLPPFSWLLIPKIDDWMSDIVSNSIDDFGLHCTFIGDGLCPDMEGWYFAPGCASGIDGKYGDLRTTLLTNTLNAAVGNGNSPDGSENTGDTMSSTDYTDETSIDVQNTTTEEEESACLTTDVDYLLNCFEMNLAQEYRVIKFDFYNDWVNGVLYFPRWMRKVKRKKRYRFNFRDGLTSYYRDKVQGCMNSADSRVKKSRYYTQQCSLSYTGKTGEPWATITTPPACNKKQKYKDDGSSGSLMIFPAKCHKANGIHRSSIFGTKSGLVTEQTTMLNQYVYYLKPCEWKDTTYARDSRTLLFATDIVLLGTLNDCDENGIPQSFKYLNNTSYIMPTNLALTTMDDDSYIYAKGDGTVCTTSIEKSSEPFSATTRVTPDFESTYNAYSKMSNREDRLNYSENDDPIPITEAAGIMWNYSGPGQDDANAGNPESPADFIKRIFSGNNKRFKYLYYPGGHFLGLSCVNSETNIKSCVNLKRICEMGATMSQRREELRGYDNDGVPKYRYYVPTGLITNVDIEGASFRAMFATMNQNKLIATDTNETTGYKKYSFTFLRPDGFDGGLFKYVHSGDGTPKDESPYNRKINNAETLSGLTDATSFFKTTFPDWSIPEDYDPEESAYTETRTVEDTIKDYYMFRFGLKSLNEKEQKKHFLAKSEYGYTLPQYENSFYFYFGLKDGSTALDEFKKQFFSECESNTVMRAPSIDIIENIDDSQDTVVCSATLIIDNMVGPYDVIFKDNTDETNYSVITTVNDTIEFGGPDDDYRYIKLIIGHEYTITVTDSLGQSITKTFTYGGKTVSINIETVNFRYDTSLTSTIPSGEDAFRYGGYFKISDELEVLGQKFKISEGQVSIDYITQDDTEKRPMPSPYDYDDVDGNTWHLYKMEKIGKYELFLNYNNNSIAIYSGKFEDNKNVEFYVSCERLGYKSGYNDSEDGIGGIPEDKWLNDPSIFGGTSKTDIASWLLRHTYYRQYDNDRNGFNSYVYTNSKDTEIAVFCQSESGGLTTNAYVSNDTYYKDDYDSYVGTTIDEAWSFIPTIYWTERTITGRNPYDCMAYTSDGRAAESASSIVITNVSTINNGLQISYNGTGNGFKVGHGCIVVFENGTIVFPVITANGTMLARNTSNPYEGVNDSDKLSKLLKLATVYPTLRVPVIYKPFYAEVSAVTWNLTGLSLEQNEEGVSTVKKVELPLSYKVEGTVHNGLTFNNKFYSGDTDTEYATYLMFRGNSRFSDILSANTMEDYKKDRTFRFGTNSNDPAFYREISGYNQSDKTISEISYAITEGFPNLENVSQQIKKEVYTGRYDGGFDIQTLTDRCSIDEAFHRNLKIMALSDSGVDGKYFLFADAIPDTGKTAIYWTKEEIFKKGQDGINGICKVKSDDKYYAYGYYNENAEYDVKGASVQILVNPNNGKCTFPLTKSNGTKVNKTFMLHQLFEKGVTVLYTYSLKEGYAKEISGITDLILPDNKIKVGYRSGDEIVKGTELNTDSNNPPRTFISVYKREDSATKKKMVVYRLYPVGALDVMYQGETGGMAEEISVSTPPEEGITYEGRTISIGVTANTEFNVSVSPEGTAWVTLNETSGGPDTQSISVTVQENDRQDCRECDIVFKLSDDESTAAKYHIKQNPQSGE